MTVKPRVTFRQINAFQAVMVSGGITAAARQLNVSQPAISRLISELERTLGLALFTRSGPRVRPTENATRLLEDVERVFFGLESIEEAARTIRRQPGRTLRIAVMPLLSMGYLAAIVRRLSERWPGLRFSIYSGSSLSIAEQLLRGEHDIGICSLPPGLRADVREIARIRANAVCAMPAGHPLAAHDSVSVTDVGSHPMIALGRTSFLRRKVSALFDDAGLTPHFVVETLFSPTAVSFVAQGLGVSVVDPFVAHMDGSEAVAVRPFLPDVPYTFSIVAATGVSDEEAAALAAAFREVMTARVPDVRIDSEPGLATPPP